MSTTRPINNPLALTKGCEVQLKKGGTSMVILRIHNGIATCEVLDGSYPARKVQVFVDQLRIAE